MGENQQFRTEDI